ncbi:SDR family NAD(P)-dependent oxidoreductase [Domibacillus iocasae]|uniref:Uncharacterized protein n=1 Tax=Domibacillus iocasae TaxID=1714016 RepID=A0A1E7DLA8_9BACI|nr:SDR family NAD(P)-dependent oxidoreductase [Domibacillus iocasae]OES43458.1 hypothetical protein BA724_13630 [Domibacillus iocasae]
MKKNKITVKKGSASFLNSHMIVVQNGSEKETIQADKFIIASGSEPVQLPFAPFDGEWVVITKGMKCHDGKIAIVTGSGRGIGKAIALRLAHDGINIVINDINEEAAQETAKEIESIRRKSMAEKADVSNREDVFSMVKQVVDHLGQLDIMISNAGRCRQLCFLPRFGGLKLYDRIICFD